MVPFDFSQLTDGEIRASARWFRSLTPEQRLEQLDRWVEEAWRIDPEFVRRKLDEVPQFTENYRVLELRDVKEGRK